MNSIEENYNTATKWRLFEEQLSMDFHAYPSIIYSKFSDKLVFASPMDSVTYQFDQTYLLRELDTIKVSISEKTAYFLGDIKEEGSIDGVKLVLSEQESEKQQELFLYRRNDALTKMNHGN